MENNKYQKKIDIAKEFLKDRQEAMAMWQEQLLDADKKYIGKMLEKREKELDRWIDETKVEIEAFENYIKGLEDYLTMDAQQVPY